MRTLILLFLTCALVGCKSQKNTAASQSAKTDSLAYSEKHRTMAVIDSLVRHIDFSFDTLKINIERPVEYAEASEIISLTAVRGRVIDQRRAYRDSIEAFNRLDTVAFHQSAAEASTGHSATTRLYNPPSANLLVAVALAIAALLLYLLIRRK